MTAIICRSSFNPGLAEESSACWLDDDCIAVAALAEPEEIASSVTPGRVFVRMDWLSTT